MWNKKFLVGLVIVTLVILFFSIGREVLVDPPLLPGQEPELYIPGVHPEDFEYLGLDPEKIQLWEDGLRTDLSENSFEWWYADAKLEDGSSCSCNVFYTI
jgi:hypothetical protein